jgi:acyl transferase domain-containing protein/NAD(P)-dependent dehydrogenase (short-subunit alcohol dehydrogenase family)
MDVQGRGFGPPLAIVGAEVLFPGSPAVSEFWRMVVAGQDQVTDIPEDYWRVEDYYDPEGKPWGTTYARRGAFVPAVPFEPAEFGIPPRSLPAIDTAQLLTLLVARDLLRNCVAFQAEKVDPQDVGVILGSGGFLQIFTQVASHGQHPAWRKAMQAAGLDELAISEVFRHIPRFTASFTEDSFPGGLSNVIAGRVTNRLGLGGTNCTVDAACASSLAALTMAARELRAGTVDMVLTGGVEANSDAMGYQCFTRTPALSKTGDARPLSDRTDGTLLGEGVGLVALRRLADAERDGDQILAVVRGVGSSSDGRAKSIYAPRPGGQVLAYRRAYESAGLSPREVELVEAHGTGTPANDAAEVAGLREVFGEADPATLQWCAIGSIKSQIGHTRAAAGAASLVKTALAVRHGVYPPTIKVERPNPKLELDASPFYVNTEARPWVHEPGTTRKAALTSLGFGGTNFHVVLEEYRGPAPTPLRHRTSPARLMLFSAASPDALGAALADAEARLEDSQALERELAGAFDASADCRLAVMVKSSEELGAALADARARLTEGGGEPFVVPGRCTFGRGPAGPVAFLVPGQGSQYVAMGRELAVEYGAFREAWDEAAGTDPEGQEPLHRLVFPPPAFEDATRRRQEESLVDTRVAQPALGVTSLGYARLLRRAGVTPGFLGGHSFGELVALHLGGAIPRAEDLLGLARARGAAMADASAEAGPSGMTAVFAPVAKVEAFLEQDGTSGLTLANVNAPEQVVVSGALAALDRLEARLEEEGLRFRRLPVSAAFHSSHVAGAASALRTRLTEIEVTAPRIPVYANATAEAYPPEPEDIREVLADQLSSPVRFADQVEAMYAAGARTFVEVGPGRVLSGLVGACLAGREHATVPLDPRPGHGALGFLEALGVLASRGAPVRYDRLLCDFAEDVAADPPSKSAVWINGSNLPWPGDQVLEPFPDATRAAPAAPVPRGPVAEPRLAAIQEVHANMATAQAAYQKALADSHQQFMKTSRALLSNLEGGASSTVGRSAEPVELPEVPAAPSAPAAAAPEATAGEDLEEMLLEVLAELTGYSRDSLDLDQDLEADLGVDSIKRVELLSEFRDRIPEGLVSESMPLLRERTLRGMLSHLGKEVVDEAASSTGASPVAPAPAPTGDVDRLVFEATPAPETCEALPGLDAGPIHVVADDLGVAPALADHLQAMGHEVRVVAEPPEEASSVISLRGLGRAPEDVEAQLAVNRQGFLDALRCGPAIRDARGVFVAVHDTGGDLNASGEGGDRAWSGGVPALVKTIAQEWPGASTKAVDVECRGRSAEEVAWAIYQELTEGGTEPEVGLRSGGLRVRPVLRPRPLNGGGRPLEAGTVVLASGGARGITAACLQALAARTPLRIAILGSTDLEAGGDDPRRVEARATLEALEVAGSEVRYFAVDVRDPEAVAGAAAQVREAWGGVQVLLHAAGINVDRPLLEKGEEEFDAVVATKVEGLRNLLAATRQDPLTHLCCFSSVVAREGNAGQVDYAVANEVLNKVCRSEARTRGSSCMVKSLAWGPWAGGMVEDHHRKLFELAGMELLPLEAGAEAFVRELEDPDRTGAVEVHLRAAPGARAG